ncbi:hypothetical protein BH11PAT2_BH11PAT2_06100 [soil metagenome]
MIHSLLHAVSSIHSSALSAAVDESGTGFLASLLMLLVLFIVAVVALILVSRWKIFKKAGKPGWASIVPIYSTVTLLEIVRKPLWWIVLMYIPFVNIVLYLIVLRRLAATFGKGTWFTIGLLFLPFIFFPILAFGSAPYNNRYAESAPASRAVIWTIVGLAFCILLESFYLGLSAYGSSGLSAATPLHKLYASGDTSNWQGWASDGTIVYYYDEALTGADPATFEILGDAGFATDDVHVYLDSTLVPGADPKSIKIINDVYATDANHVYSRSYSVKGQDVITPIEGADVASFKAADTLYSMYAYDKNHVYFYDSVIAGADSKTFKVLGGGAGQSGYYSKDATHVFLSNYVGSIAESSVVKGADIATFDIADTSADAGLNYDALDKNYHYLNGERVSK